MPNTSQEFANIFHSQNNIQFQTVIAINYKTRYIFSSDDQNRRQTPLDVKRQSLSGHQLKHQKSPKWLSSLRESIETVANEMIINRFFWFFWIQYILFIANKMWKTFGLKTAITYEWCDRRSVRTKSWLFTETCDANNGFQRRHQISINPSLRQLILWRFWQWVTETSKLRVVDIEIKCSDINRVDHWLSDPSEYATDQYLTRDYPFVTYVTLVTHC